MIRLIKNQYSSDSAIDTEFPFAKVPGRKLTLLQRVPPQLLQEKCSLPYRTRGRTAEDNFASSRTISSKLFTDKDIQDFNSWAEEDDASTVKFIKRVNHNSLLFVLRTPLKWKRVKTDINERGEVFDLIISDGASPGGIHKENQILRSILIIIKDEEGRSLGDLPFFAKAYSDEEGKSILNHPNVRETSGEICMGDLSRYTLLKAARISDIVTLLESINMTSKYHNIYVDDASGGKYSLEEKSTFNPSTGLFKQHSFF
jgi:hypothetical protein